MIEVGDLKLSNELPLVLIAGPCQLESLDHAVSMSTSIKQTCKHFGIPFIYKTSFDKANRTSIDGQRGMGIDAAIDVFTAIKETVECPILTDVHNASQCAKIAPVVDVLQIPAFLCRQTDLLIAAGETGLPINIKKGQFLAPEDMINVIRKIESTGNTNILVCERGSSFGYNNLVVDFRSIPIMKEFGYPVVMDATHAVQRPGGNGTSTGGDRKFVSTLARSAIVNKIASLFIEVHDDPDNAPSDGPNMLKLSDLSAFIEEMSSIDFVVKNMR